MKNERNIKTKSKRNIYLPFILYHMQILMIKEMCNVLIKNNVKFTSQPIWMTQLNTQDIQETANGGMAGLQLQII